MKSSSKQAAENNRGISGHVLTLHQRLYHALNLGLRSYSNRERKWQCTDAEIQRHVVRSIDAFLDCVTNETSQHSLVKESVADMVVAMVGILHLKNEFILSLVSTVAVKMVKALPSSLVQSHVLDIIHPLSSLLSSHHVQVSLSFATALSLIISNMSIKKDTEVWDILRETKTVANTVSNIKKFPGGAKPIEYLQEMVSLLSKILWRWPSSRFYIWSDAKFLEVLDSFCLEPSSSVKVSVLQLYSAIALCGNGAEKLLENGKNRLQMMLDCMGSSDHHSSQMEGFKLAQCFAISEDIFLRMLNMCCEPLVKAIINGMNNCSLDSGKPYKDRISLLLEACRLAMITRWAGKHHKYFWKFGIDTILLNLLLSNFDKKYELQHLLSLEEQIAIAQEGLKANHLLVLRPYIWDILGGLASHCVEDFDPKMHGNKFHINKLITCACLCFMESTRTTRQICQNDIATMFGNEAASRAVLLMIYSPCKYISTQSKAVLCEILRPDGIENLNYSLNTLNAITSRDFKLSDNLQMVINLISLACYSGLPRYGKHIIKSHGIRMLSAFLSRQLGNPFHIKRSTVALHLHNPCTRKACCYDFTEEWEGEDMLLLFGLWGLAELLHHFNYVKNDTDMSVSQTYYCEAQLVSQLQEISSGPFAAGPRWYAAYALSIIGHYGLPIKPRRIISKELNETEHTDLKLILANDESVSVHAVILMVRCPALLPLGEVPLKEKTSKASLLNKNIGRCKKSTSSVRLSTRVDHRALLKLLEFIYSGYLHAEEDLVKKLKLLAKHCNLHHLLQLLCKSRPKWGSPIPSYDLKSALGQAGHDISDIILEAKVDEPVQNYSCSICCLSVPHMHVHKVILCSSCDYLRALFQSGMKESQSQTIKVPISWQALVKLVNWFYSNVLPLPVSGCLWNALSDEEKLQELENYLELCWLAEFWLLDDLHKECSRVIMSCLDSTRDLSIKILKLAASLSQWRLAEVAADYVAPLYHQLRISGELETLDEEFIEMVRSASVRLSQNEGGHSS